MQSVARVRLALMGLLLLSLASIHAFAQDRWEADTGNLNYGLWLRAKPVPSIPWDALDASNATTSAEKLAVMANLGHAIWARVRETQDRYRWFAGEVVPRTSVDDEFCWPAEQGLALVVGDSARVAAAEIIATEGPPFIGNQLRPMPLIPISPSGARLRFKDFLTEFPSGAKCAVYVAFPRAGLDVRRVSGLAIVTREKDQASAGLPQPGSTVVAATEGGRQ
jgi:hypothetical protein